ncbi:MAG: hypothetical protein Q9197_005059 [Variospora fuerteventurae]
MKAALSSSESGLVQTYSAHGYEVLDLSVTADNARFDATVRLWDCKSQSTKPIQVLDDSKDSVSSLHVLGHEVVTGSVDGRMRLYDLRMGMMYADIIGRKLLMSSSTIPLCDAEAFPAYLDPITSIQQTSDGNAVLVSTLDSTIRLMDKSNGQMLQSYKGHLNKDYRIRSCLGPGDSMVISGSEDGKIYAWDLFTGKVFETLSAHDAKVASAVTCNILRNEFASAGADGKTASSSPVDLLVLTVPGSVIVWSAT